jgi:hypothetical protein
MILPEPAQLRWNSSNREEEKFPQPPFRKGGLVVSNLIVEEDLGIYPFRKLGSIVLPPLLKGGKGGFKSFPVYHVGQYVYYLIL